MRAKLHAAWLEQQDTARVEALLHGVKNGFRKKRSALDDEASTPTLATSLPSSMSVFPCPYSSASSHRLHAAWLEQQDTARVEALLYGITNGFRKESSAPEGGKCPFAAFTHLLAVCRLVFATAQHHPSSTRRGCRRYLHAWRRCTASRTVSTRSAAH